MSKRIFSQEQIEVLLQNPNVKECSTKSISYHKDFKLFAVKQYESGLSASEIFKQAGLEATLVGSNTAKECLRRWLETYKAKGEAGLQRDGRKSNNPRGRPRDPVNLTEKEKLEYLEAQVAYLKAENAFLAKLRKQRLN